MKSRRLSGLILAAAALTLFGAAPAIASGTTGVRTSSATHKPDGWVRYEGQFIGDYEYNPGAWSGKDIYNTTGLNQTKTKRYVGAYDNEDYAAFDVKIQNDGSSDRFKIHGVSDWSGAPVKYYSGMNNVTSAVKAGTFKTPLLAKGATFLLSVRVGITSVATLITATSVADPTKKDTVGVKVRLTCGC